MHNVSKIINKQKHLNILWQQKFVVVNNVSSFSHLNKHMPYTVFFYAHLCEEVGRLVMWVTVSIIWPIPNMTKMSFVTMAKYSPKLFTLTKQSISPQATL